MKVRRRFCDQDGDSIFELFPLLLEQDSLGPRDIQKRLFLRNVQPGGHPAFMPGIHQLQAFLQRLHGSLQDSQLGIELSQGEIIACKFRRDHQPHIFEIGRACLVGRLRCLNAAAPPAKQIYFVADCERQNNVGLRYGRPHWEVAIGGPVSGKPLALGTGGGRKKRELRGDLDCRGSARLLQPCGRDFDGLICVERLFFHGAQIVVVENAPPFTLGKIIFRGTRAPGLRDVPFCGHGRRGTLVLWPHSATANERTNSKPGQGGKLPEAFHYCFLTPGAGFGCAAGWLGAWFSAISLTWTSWPSSRESAGFSTIQSLTSRPCRTSRVVP